MLSSRLLPAALVLVVFAFSAGGTVLIVTHAIAGERALREAQIAQATVLRNQLDLETALRGYAATGGDRVFLSPYRHALASFDPSVARARFKFARLGAPGALAVLSSERRIHQEWVARVAQPLIADAHRAGATAIELKGKRLIDGFRNDNDRAIAIFNAAAGDLERRQESGIGLLIGVALILGLLFATIVYWFGEQQRRAREESRRQTLLYEREREVADILQRAVIERELPSIPGLKIDASYRAAAQDERVGGDWFDIFALPDGRLLVVIGDVVGHGLAAAIAMRDTRHAILGAALHETQPGPILTTANRHVLRRQAREPIATVACAFIDPATREVRYASAGHPSPIVAAGTNAFRLHDEGSLPLGIEDCGYPTRVDTLPLGSTLIFYTDGLTEFTHNVIEGEQRLISCAASLSSMDAGTLAGALLRAVLGDVLPSDDVAIVAVTMTEVDVDRASDRVEFSSITQQSASQLG